MSIHVDEEARWILAWVEISERWNSPGGFNEFVSGLLDDLAESYEHDEVNDAQLARWLASTTLSEDLGGSGPPF